MSKQLKMPALVFFSIVYSSTPYGNSKREGCVESTHLHLHEVMKLVYRREIARKSEDFKESDKLRHQIKKLGYEIEDTPTGPKIKQVVN